MKSKTFVMMFVAIGCGLVAAYLTARLTAGVARVLKRNRANGADSSRRGIAVAWVSRNQHEGSLAPVRYTDTEAWN